MPDEAIDYALHCVREVEGGSLVARNAVFTDYLQNGIESPCVVGGEERTFIVSLVDYNHPERNTFHAINQWTVQGRCARRPDVVLFVNGLPLVVIELKNPSKPETTVHEAYLQIRNYLQDIPELFIYNQICVASDMVSTKAGSITADESWYKEWKSIDGAREDCTVGNFETLIHGLLAPARLLDVVKNFVCFSGEGHDAVKILAGYHQYFAVRKAVAKARAAMETDGRGGVFIFFSTIQKFEEANDALTERRDIIVIADEAHRGHYGFAETEKIIRQKDGTVITRRSVPTARIIHDSLPKATFIGFTGTPLDAGDRSTREVFGDYIDIYDMTQAVEDGATRPIYYESRVVKLNLKRNVLEEIDREYARIAAEDEADEAVIAQSKRDLSQMEMLLGHDDTIESLVDDILLHYEGFREGNLAGKAMIVAYSRPIAIKIYERFLAKRPAWRKSGKIQIVMTEGNQDPEAWRAIIGTKKDRLALAVEFKKADSAFKIAIVVDMWLTGFDVPCLETMYVYKPMVGHNLMQAIARVNRVYRDKTRVLSRQEKGK